MYKDEETATTPLLSRSPADGEFELRERGDLRKPRGWKDKLIKISLWLGMLFLISNLGFGVYFGYDSLGALEDRLDKERGIDAQKLGVLYSAYAAPSILSSFASGILINKLGLALMGHIFALTVVVGSVLVAIGENFGMMLLGRLIYGLGAEPLLVCQNTMLSMLFENHLSVAFGLMTAWIQAGSAVSMLILPWVETSFSLKLALLLVAVANFLSLLTNAVYTWITKSERMKTLWDQYVNTPDEPGENRQWEVGQIPQNNDHDYGSFSITHEGPSLGSHRITINFSNDDTSEEEEEEEPESTIESSKNEPSSVVVRSLPRRPHTTEDEENEETDYDSEETTSSQQEVPILARENRVPEKKKDDENNEEKEKEHKFRFKDLWRLPPSYWFLSFMSVLYSANVYTFVSFGPLFFREKFGYDNNLGGKVISIINFSVLFLAPPLGYLIDRIGRRGYIFALCGVVYTLSYAVFAMYPGNELLDDSGTHEDKPEALALAIVVSTVIGITFSVTESCCYASVPLVVDHPSMITVGYGIIAGLMGMGLFVVPYTVGALRDWLSDFKYVLWFFSFVSFVAFLCSILMIMADKRGWQWSCRKFEEDENEQDITHGLLTMGGSASHNN